MKNKFEVFGDKVRIVLRRNKGVKTEYVWISKSKLGKMAEFPNTWFFAEGYKGVNYAIGFRTINGKKQTVRMHRYLLEDEINIFKESHPNENVDIDHFDGDGLNNTDENIYVCTHQENMEGIMINKKYDMRYFNRKKMLRNFQLQLEMMKNSGFTIEELRNMLD